MSLSWVASYGNATIELVANLNEMGNQHFLLIFCMKIGEKC